MNLAKYFSFTRWRSSFSIPRFVVQIIQGFVLLWTFTEPLLAYFPDVIENMLISRPQLVVLGAICFSFYTLRPKDIYKYSINGRDIEVELRIGDAFDIKGSKVIPTNYLFEADIKGRMLGANSLQGKLLRDYYYSDTHKFQDEIDRAIATSNYESEASPIDISGKVYKKFPIGTVIQLERNQEHFYLLANTRITGDGVASSTEQELITSLEKLWTYISEKGKKTPIVIPLIGTQHGRFPLKRERVIQHILHTFITSCEAKSYCPKMTLVIYPPDLQNRENRIDLKLVNEMIRAMTEFPYFRKNP